MNKKHMLKISNIQFFTLITSIIILYLGAVSFTFISENDQVVVMRFNQHIKTINNPGVYWINIIGRKLIWYDKRLLLAQANLNEKLFINQSKTKITIALLYKIKDPLILHLTNTNLEETLNIILKGQIRSSLYNENLDNFVNNYKSNIARILAGMQPQCQALGLIAVDLHVYM